MMERRFDPTTREWRTFATHRQDRTFLPAADHCPLCPTKDPSSPSEVPASAYELVVFDNRFPALVADPPPPSLPSSRFYPVEAARGASEVVVYSDDHHATLAELGADHIRRLVDVWADRYRVLGSRDEVAYVFVFENRGEVIGVTLEHPHGQIYAYPDIPPRPRAELDAGLGHLRRYGTCVFCDIVARERADRRRLIGQSAGFLAFVPFAARFPYEVHLTAQRHATSLLDLTDPERDALAQLLETVLRGLDALFGFPLPYVMSMHQAPTDDGPWQEVSHFHIELTPVHRTATKLKYLAGSEIGAGAFINDMTPEVSAAELRAAVLGAQR